MMYAKGHGTVVTGRVEQGTIKVGEEVEVSGLMHVYMEVEHVPHCQELSHLTMYLSLLIGWTFEDYCNWGRNVQENVG